MVRHISPPARNRVSHPHSALDADEPSVAVALDGEPYPKADRRVPLRNNSPSRKRNALRKQPATSNMSTTDGEASPRHAKGAIFAKHTQRQDRETATDQATIHHNPHLGKISNHDYASSAFNDQRDEDTARRSKASGAVEAREHPVAQQPRAESIIEKKRRMVLYKERLKKKSTDGNGSEPNQSAKKELPVEVSSAMTVATASVAPRTVERPTARDVRDQSAATCAFTNGRSPTSSAEHRQLTRRLASQTASPRSMSRGREPSSERVNIVNTNPPRPQLKLKPKQSSERVNAPSKMAAHATATATSISSSRHSSIDGMAAASTDPLTMYQPKSPRSHLKASRWNREKSSEKDLQPDAVRKAGVSDDDHIARASADIDFPPKRQSPTRSFRVLSRKSPTSLRIRSPPHGLHSDAALNFSERNYTSIVATLGGKISSHRNLTEIPSPQNRGLDAAGGSSIFSAITDTDTAVEKAAVLPSTLSINSGIPDDKVEDLELDASSSLFSFPSNDSGDHLRQEQAMPASAAAESENQADDKSSLDSLYADLDDGKLPARLDTAAAETDIPKRGGSVFSFPSVCYGQNKTPCRPASPKTIDILTANDKECNRDFSAKEGSKKSVSKRLVARKAKLIFPFLFKSKGGASGALKDEDVGKASGVSPRRAETHLVAQAQDFTQQYSDDDDSKTMITVLEPSDRDGTAAAIEVSFTPTNAAVVVEDVDNKELAVATTRPSPSYKMRSPTKLLRFPSLVTRVRSASKAPDRPVYSVRVTLGYLLGVQRVGRVHMPSDGCSDTVGFAYVEETHAVSCASSQMAESKQITTTASEAISACNIVWSDKRLDDKTRGRLYFSVVQESADRSATQIARLVVGVKMGHAIIRLGTVSLSIQGTAVKEKQCTFIVTPETRNNAQPQRCTSMRSSGKLDCFSDDDRPQYELGLDAMLRVRLDVMERRSGLDGPALWGDTEDDAQSFVHSLNDLEVGDEEGREVYSSRELVVGNDLPDEHLTSIEVVPQANGATCISAITAGKKRERNRVRPSSAIIKSDRQPCENLELDPFVGKLKCVDPILLKDERNSIARGDNSLMDDDSLMMETEILVSPGVSDDDTAIFPATTKKPFFGILKRRVRNAPRVNGDSKCPTVDALHSQTAQEPISNGGIKTRPASVAEESVEVEHLGESSIDCTTSRSFHSQDGESHESNTRQTKNTHPTRNAPTSEKSAAPIDRAAQWLIQSFKGLIGSSSDSDDHDRQTTYSQSTGYDTESIHHLSGFTEVTDDGEGQAVTRRQLVSVQQLDAVISGLSDAASEDSDQETSISKDICDDLKRLLAIAKQLNMPPEELVERIAAGERVEKLLQDIQRRR